MYFMKDLVASTMKELGTQKIVDAAKFLGQKWSTMSVEEKKPYVDKSEADKVRFNNQTSELKSKGYFTLEDGTKSTDFRPKEPKMVGKKRTL